MVNKPLSTTFFTNYDINELVTIFLYIISVTG